MTALGLILLALSQDAVDVEGQPLAENSRRLLEALEFLGSPLPAERAAAVRAGIEAKDARKIQEALDPEAAFVVDTGAEFAARRGRGAAALQQGAYAPLIVKVRNGGGVRGALRLSSPQSGPVYAGVADLSMKRQNQPRLRENENTRGEDRFLDLEMFAAPPMTPELSGLAVEYAIALVYSSVEGRREATIGFEVAGGKGSVTSTYEIRAGVAVRLSVLDHDGAPTTGRFTFRDRAGRVYPPQPKRLAPDFFFQKQVYRAHGQTILLPPGELEMEFSRGPEYRLLRRTVSIPGKAASIEVRLERWVNPPDHGFYGGDHHIHAAGCAHYARPTEGVLARDMFPQVKGEGLNVGCILTWGPCFDFQSTLFSPGPDAVSEPLTLLKYDVEVSGFGSQALGHVCLLNLKEQAYPGSTGTKGWPTWTTPVLRWAKAQGSVTGYAHSASGLQVDPGAAARRLHARLKDGKPADAQTRALLPEDFAAVDADRDGALGLDELAASHARAADRLPNVAVPEMNSVGAMEIFVTVPEGLCDFISAMDTARIPEWNCWYHILNCGFPLKVSGETDFPCMSGTRVGQGRVYVKLGKVDRIDYGAWCEGLRAGRSYVSDGYAHALAFTVEGREAGGSVALDRPGTVTVRAKVAFSSQTPAEVPYGGALPRSGLHLVGDTVNLHEAEARATPSRRVEVVMNGLAVASKEVPADDRVHDVEFSVPVERSSWIALRHFPQLHTNPVNVSVEGKPIRASRRSALWCVAAIEQLWRVRGRNIAPAEREEAKRAFDRAIERYRALAAECPEER